MLLCCAIGLATWLVTAIGRDAQSLGITRHEDLRLAYNPVTYRICRKTWAALPSADRYPKSRIPAGNRRSCGGRIRTYDLEVMSLASYRAAPPRDELPFSSDESPEKFYLYQK